MNIELRREYIERTRKMYDTDLFEESKRLGWRTNLTGYGAAILGILGVSACAFAASQNDATSLIPAGLLFVGVVIFGKKSLGYMEKMYVVNQERAKRGFAIVQSSFQSLLFSIAPNIDRKQN